MRGSAETSMAMAPAPCVDSPPDAIPYLAMSLAITKTFEVGNCATWLLAKLRPAVAP
ncbi:Uncharacterised protein [Chlamydia trachomatis]|nr:Uncharacterised protein [Chlamydia trachomatis]